MGDDLFYAGAEAVAPVGRKDSAGNIDALIEGIWPGKLREEC